MRITRDSLLKLARDTAHLYARQDRSIVAIYLIGSLLTEEPLLGGSTDIDLVFVHDGQPVQEREIVRMSDDVHLDIAHHSHAQYEQPRQLRIDPWVGPAIHDHPIVLHDTQHWFEFTQASAGSQFNRSDYKFGRARPFSDAARQGWLRLHTASPGQFAGPEALKIYLQSIEMGANAVASLAGAPLTERRFLPAFEQRSHAINQPGLSAGLRGLTGENLVDATVIQSWLPSWADAFNTVGNLPDTPARLNPARLSYYQKGILSQLRDDHPDDALWPLLTTWTLAATSLPAGALQLTAWEEVTRQLHLGTDDFPERVDGLDAYLDHVEEVLDTWAHENGVFDETAV